MSALLGLESHGAASILSSRQMSGVSVMIQFVKVDVHKKNIFYFTK